MANPRNQIHIVKRSKKEAIDNLKKNNISQVLIDILEDFMDRVIKCIDYKTNTYEKYRKEFNISEEEARKRELKEYLKSIGIIMQNINKEIPVTFHDDIKDCISRVMRQGGEKGEWIFGENLDKGICPSVCGPVIMAHAYDGWKFTDHKFVKNLVSYWLRCFQKNKSTVIFSDSYDGRKFPHFKSLFMDAYIEGGNGIHEVVFIMYDQKHGFLVKFP